MTGAKVGVPLDRVKATQADAKGLYSLWTVWRDRWRAGEDFPIDVPELKNNPNLYPTAGVLGNTGDRTNRLSHALSLAAVVGAVVAA